VVKRDPHNTNVIGVAVDGRINIVDLRKDFDHSKSNSFLAHSEQVLDFAFNTNALNTLASCGNDGTVRFWDIRKPDRCLLQFEDHHSGHWLTKVRYNSFHDQLLLTGCTSTFVSLYRAISVSSQPSSTQLGIDLNNTNTFNMSIGDMTERTSNGGRSYIPADSLSQSSVNAGSSGGRGAQGGMQQSSSAVQDKCVQRYELEDSVTAIEWSAADAWVFAALSYNGTFCINMVPSKEKYRILL